MSEIVAGPWGPWLLLLLCGILPSEVWRVLGAVLSRGMDEASPLFTWVRLVATALLAAVVAKILASGTGALAAVPVWGRAGGLVAGFVVYGLLRRSRFANIAGVIAGEAVLIASAWWTQG